MFTGLGGCSPSGLSLGVELPGWCTLPRKRREVTVVAPTRVVHGDRLLLSGVGAVVDDEPDDPIAVAHRTGCDSGESEAESVERHVAEAPAIHAEREREDAVSFVGGAVRLDDRQGQR